MKENKTKKQLAKDNYHYIVTVGVTWVSGKIIFKEKYIHSNVYYGICHYSKGVFAISPIDYERPLMINTILISPKENFCEKASSCLNLKCSLNRFDKDFFLKEFNEVSTFSLGISSKIGTKPLWFNDGEYKTFWPKFIESVEGGIYKFDPDKKSSKEIIL